LLLAALGLVLGVLWSATRVALANLSGGTVRKLELKNRGLAARLEAWLARREELGIQVRLLLLLDFFFLFVCLSSWDAASAQNGWAIRLGPVFVGMVVFFVSTEVLGRHLSSLMTARLLSFSVPLVSFCAALVFPLSILLRAGHCWAKGWRAKHVAEAEEATAEDEIMSLVEQDEQEDDHEADLEADERRMIRGIFDLDETLVHEVMTPRVDVDAVAEGTSVSDIKSRIIDSGHSRIPVYHGTIDQITGVIYAKDLLDDARVNAASSGVDLLRRPVFIPETKNIGDLLTEFQQNNNHFAVVLDEYGGTAGIVTFEDILEEIVGEIRDEFDINETEATRQVLPDGDVVMDARLGIDELNEALGLQVSEDEDFDTIGGYISAFAGRILQAGDVIDTGVLCIEVMEADPRHILTVKIKKIEKDAADDGT